MRRDSPDTNSQRTCPVFGDFIYRSHESWETYMLVQSSFGSNKFIASLQLWFLPYVSLNHTFTICFYRTADTLEYIIATRVLAVPVIIIYPFGSIPFTFHVRDACLGAESVIFVFNIVGLFYLPLFDFRVEVKSRRTHFISIRKYLAFSSRDKITIATHTRSHVGTYATDAMACPQCLSKFVKCVHDARYVTFTIV